MASQGRGHSDPRLQILAELKLQSTSQLGGRVDETVPAMRACDGIVLDEFHTLLTELSYALVEVFHCPANVGDTPTAKPGVGTEPQSEVSAWVTKRRRLLELSDGVTEAE